ncbi:hypothetical protein N7481_003222, partial [Penicillium waksmanii]|uniref:uncharacterized protein n=1 Tax=Penicillium waksmanii TaxID=69791 RepID=UPI002547A583
MGVRNEMMGPVSEGAPPGGVTADGTDTQESEEPTTEYMQGWALVSLTPAFMSICFVLAIDNTILATAIPSITSDFHSLNDIGWYGSSYLIAQMSLMPTCGRLYSFYNIKWIYCGSLAVFELSSVVSAVAPNSIVLIIGRAISGLRAAGLVSGTTTILSYCVSLQKQAMLSPIVLGMYNIGSAIGPLVGGSITDNKTLTWRFVFWINLPFGAIGLALVWFTLRKPPPAVKVDMPWIQKLRQLDLPGAILLLGVRMPDWLRSSFGCVFGLTIPRQRKSVRNTNAEVSRINLLPLIVSNSISMLCAGVIVSKFGHYLPLMWIGPLILATGGGLYELVRVDSARGQWIGLQILSGIGYGCCNQLPILAVQVVLEKRDIPTGLVMIMFFQMLGGALGPSIGQNLFTDGLLRNLSEIQGIDGAAIVAVGASGFREVTPPESMNVVVGAFNSALKDVFWVALATPSLAWMASWAMERLKLPSTKKLVTD